MAYEALSAYIQSIVRTNLNEEITGQNLQDVLLSIVQTLGVREFRGVAGINSNPGIPAGPAIYIASQEGFYQYFNLTVNPQEIVLFIWEASVASWRRELIISLPAPFSQDRYFRHVQSVPEAIWNITHNLGKIPSVTVTDSSGTEIEGDVLHNDSNSLKLTFSAAFAGFADLN